MVFTQTRESDALMNELLNSELPEFNFTLEKPLIIIISGLSGAGKDTVINQLRNNNEYDFHFVVTCNTRAKRHNEIDGVDYHFVTREQFLQMIAKDELIEYSSVYSDFKGVPRVEIEKAFKKGKDMILRLDHQGTCKFKEAYPEAISIFIVPPDPQTWIKRLNERGGQTDEDLRIRIKTAKEELAAIEAFDYLVINDRMEDTMKDVSNIIRAEHHRISRIFSHTS